MVSPTVNVVRYTALLGGVLYGISHRRTLQSQKNETQRHDAVHHREELIHRAKEAYKQSLVAPKDALVTDPEDPKFDLEKLISKWEKDSQ